MIEFGPGASIPQVEGKIIDRKPKGCELDMPEPFTIVIFGASGDLTRRKIMPAIYRLSMMGLLTDNFCVLGAARTELDDEGFRAVMKKAVKEEFPDKFSEEVWKKLAGRLFYRRVDYSDHREFAGLKEALPILESIHKTAGNRILYLATPPAILETVIRNIGDSGLSLPTSGYTHVVIEKPFGRDLETARNLNSLLRKYFKEKQIYRMDHYLAKENVQNMLVFRFANSIFEPLWNRRYIDHVQISVTETLGIGHRSGYYETAGVIRDMFQNHLLQLFALIAMEPPSVFDSERIRDEKAKVLRSIRPFPLNNLGSYLVTGQYGKGIISGEEVPAYREEPGVAPDSFMPTYAAMKVYIDNWRWNGVPFYLRSGKRLYSRKAEISIHFKQVPHLMFQGSMADEIEPNTLVLRVQPEEGMSLSLQTKNPGSKLCLNHVLMDFTYQEVFMLYAYERVLLDCMQGDQMLFVRADGVEETWELLTPLLEATESSPEKIAFPNYAAGTSGPPEADALLRVDGRSWRPL